MSAQKFWFNKTQDAEVIVKFDFCVLKREEYFCNKCGQKVNESHFIKQGNYLICPENNEPNSWEGTMFKK